MNTNVEIKIIHARQDLFNRLLINGEDALEETIPDIRQYTMDNIFKCLNSHEYRKFFI